MAPSEPLFPSSCSEKCHLNSNRISCKDCIDHANSTYGELQKKVHFLQLFDPGPESEKFQGDITFVGCDEEPVYAHRFIMASRSSVFRRMFEVDMKEKESGTVRVRDATAPVLRSMVNYCYTADMEFTEAAPAEEVLKLAHKYNINELKAVCESELSMGINQLNLCDTVKLAQMYSAKELQEAARKFVKKNFDPLWSTVIVEKLSKT